jgi:hypothetical protein
MMSRVRTILRLAAGFGLLIVGCVLALPGVPGPGIVLILLGLVLLSDHFAWARRALAWARQELARLKRRVLHQQGKPRDGEPRASTEWNEQGGPM